MDTPNTSERTEALPQDALLSVRFFNGPREEPLTDDQKRKIIEYLEFLKSR